MITCLLPVKLTKPANWSHSCTLVFNSNNLEKALDGIECVLPESAPASDDTRGWRRVWLAGEMATVPELEAIERDEVGADRFDRLLHIGSLVGRYLYLAIIPPAFPMVDEDLPKAVAAVLRRCME